MKQLIGLGKSADKSKLLVYNNATKSLEKLRKGAY